MAKTTTTQQSTKNGGHPYRSADKKINWKSMVTKMNVIFDHEGIKAPDVMNYSGNVKVMYYVYHFLKFHILFRNNNIKDSRRWIILQALRTCGVQLDSDCSNTPSGIMENIPTLFEDDSDKFDLFHHIFDDVSDDYSSGLYLFKEIKWGYLKDLGDYEGFNSSEGDVATDYGFEMDKGTVPALAPVSSVNKIPKKVRRSPYCGDVETKANWDKANFCELCRLGMKSRYAFITPGKVDGFFKVKATSASITAFIYANEDRLKRVKTDLLSKDNQFVNASTWAQEINRQFIKHWEKVHSGEENKPDWACTQQH